jgi:mono/diheme cytochrome c family protein
MAGRHRPVNSCIRIGLAISALALGFAAAALRASAQPAGAPEAELARGRELFVNHCASCHGSNGTGNGPLAAAMRRPPPDITDLALENGGVFPADRLRRIVDGRAVEAHGDREMPVWGDAFKSGADADREKAARERISAILKYVASIQRQRG